MPFGMTQRQAEVGAKKLLRMMKSPGWKVRIWYNLGWNYQVFKDYLRVSPSVIPGKFYCGMSFEADGNGTPAFLYRNGVWKDPNTAVKKQIAYARAQTDAVNAVVTKVETGEKLKCTSVKMKRT